VVAVDVALPPLPPLEIFCSEVVPVPPVAVAIAEPVPDPVTLDTALAAPPDTGKMKIAEGIPVPPPVALAVAVAMPPLKAAASALAVALPEATNPKAIPPVALALRL